LDDVARQVKRRIWAHVGTKCGVCVGLCAIPLFLYFLYKQAPPIFFLLPALLVYSGVKIFAKAQLGFKPEFSEAAGSASWAKRRDLKRAGLIGRKINPTIHPYLGQFAMWSWLRWRTVFYDVHYPGAIHWTMCGPTGVGKDTGLICWNIRNLTRLSKVILDIKGEAAVRCARWCREHGQQVVILNLFNMHVTHRPDLVSQGYNCLEGFDVLHPRCYEFCKANSAAMIVRRDGESGHWDSRAEALLTFCQLAMKWAEFDGKLLDEQGNPCRRSANLADVQRMLWAPYRYGEKTKEQKDKDRYSKVKARRRSAKVDDDDDKKKPMSLHQMIHDAMLWEDKAGEPSRETLRFAAAAYYSENISNEEISGSIATAQGQLEPLLSDSVRNDLMKHPMVSITITDPKTRKKQRVKVPFKFEYLRDEPIAVFVILPFEARKRLAIWTRLILTRAIDGITKGERRPKVHSWLVVNEAHSVGNLKVLEDAMSAVRYAGLHIWTIWQSFRQISKNFGDSSEFLSNSGVITSYRVGERETADEMHWRLGTTTEVTEAVSSSPRSDNDKRNKTRTGGGFSLMNREELTGLAPREVITFVSEYIHKNKPVRLRTPVRLDGLDPFMEDVEVREAA
jgi:type IV secretory pathway TraG/TraD family ATPase VirD4